MGEKYPELQHLTNAEEKNKDGIGIAYANGKEVIIKKDFKNATECHKWLLENVPIEYGVVIHLRSGTAGLMDEGNRHPFPLTADMELMRKTNQSCKIALAHNGVFTNVDTHEKYSDSMMFIATYLHDIKEEDLFNDGAVQRLIGAAVGVSRLAVIRAEGNIVYFGKFFEHENGCLYSNEAYKKVEYLPAYYGRKDHSSLSRLYNGGSSNIYDDYETEDIYKKHGYGVFKGKKSKHCDICLKKKKSKWHKDRMLYACQSCMKELDKREHKDGAVKCEVCETSFSVITPSVVSYRANVNMKLCDECYKNEIWFRAILKQDIEGKEVTCGNDNKQGN